MPKGDGTGPQGYGPRTGHGCGPCGWGFHHSPCWRFWHHPFHQKTLTQKEEKEMLEDEVKNLEQELAGIKERLAEIQQ
jgi:hypothetical protein